MNENDVSVVPCDNYDDELVESALRDVLEPIRGLDFVRPGMTVAIKVNLVSAMKPDSAATVHPSVVCALTRLLRERGAQVVIGDSPGGLYTAAYLKVVYDVCGMRKAEAFGARLNDDFSTTQITFPEAAKAKQFPYTAWLQKADAVIDLCKLKTHGMMGLTCAVKNFFGVIPGTQKPEFHYRFPRAEDFADMLVDLYEYVAPKLCICDAVIGMEGNGPTQGMPRKIGCLLAGTNGHQLDAVAAGLIGMTVQDIPTLRAAAARGLLEPDGLHKKPKEISEAERLSTAVEAPIPPQKHPSRESAVISAPGTGAKPTTFSCGVPGLRIFGDPTRFAIPDFKTVQAQSSVFFMILGDGIPGKIADFFASRLLTPFPKLVSSACVGCAKCANVCPAKAITMVDQKPKINRKTCIHCFCCQEFCPKGAMQVGRHAVMKLLGK